MDERGLLDLMIARLVDGRPGSHAGELSYKEKILLCETFNTEQDLIQCSALDLKTIIGRKLAAFWDIDAIRLLAQRDAATALEKGINWLSWTDRAYPPLLREIYDPPVVLFFKGALPNPETPLVAVVGTRRPSSQAAAQAFEITKDLGRSGISVVSGLALGIDAMAHRGNIEGGAPTVAVLGSGLDYIYPLSNRKLAMRILETGGSLLSEYPPGTSPRKWNFPARNRIISGISRSVLIVEAPQKSGALITARFALEHNRELWVASCGVDGDGGQHVRFDCMRRTEGSETNTLPKRQPLAGDRRGTTKLAEEGAEIIRDASDILQAWNMGGNEIAAIGAAGGVVDSVPPEVTSGAALASSLAQSLGVAL